MPFVATRMGPDYYAQSEKYHMYCLYVESEKLVQMNLLTKQKQSHRCRKQTYGNWEERGRGITWEVETDIYTVLYIK